MGEKRGAPDRMVADPMTANPMAAAHMTAGDTTDDGTPEPTAPPASAGSPLADLLAHIETQRAARYRAAPVARPGNVPAPGATYPELGDTLEAFRAIWSRLSANQQLRQSLDHVPPNAGPLNSSSLIHRALSSMQTLSPDYLQRFLSYADALSWLEQLEDIAPARTRDTPRGKKPARRGGR